MHAVVNINMIMTGLEHKKQIIIISVFKAHSTWTIYLVKITIGRRNIVVFHKSDFSESSSALRKTYF